MVAAELELFAVFNHTMDAHLDSQAMQRLSRLTILLESHAQ
jgi:hypothetical protein